MNAAKRFNDAWAFRNALPPEIQEAVDPIVFEEARKQAGSYFDQDPLASVTASPAAATPQEVWEDATQAPRSAATRTVVRAEGIRPTASPLDLPPVVEPDLTGEITYTAPVQCGTTLHGKPRFWEKRYTCQKEGWALALTNVERDKFFVGRRNVRGLHRFLKALQVAGLLPTSNTEASELLKETVFKDIAVSARTIRVLLTNWTQSSHQQGRHTPVDEELATAMLTTLVDAYPNAYRTYRHLL